MSELEKALEKIFEFIEGEEDLKDFCFTVIGAQKEEVVGGDRFTEDIKMRSSRPNLELLLVSRARNEHERFFRKIIEGHPNEDS